MMVSHEINFDPATWLPLRLDPDVDIQLLNTRGFEEALALLQDASAEKPGLLYNRGLVLLRAGRRDEARADLEIAAALLPDFPYAQVALLLADATLSLEERLAALHDHAAAHPELPMLFTAAIAHMKAAQPTLQRVDAPAEEIARQAGWGMIAHNLMMQATDRHPESVEAWYLRGGVALRDDQNELGEECFTRALDLRPDDLEILTERGRCRTRQLRFDEAVADYEEAIRRNPDYGKAYAYMRIAYQRAGRDEEALRVALTMIERFPRNSIGYSHLVQMHLKAQDPAKALEVMDEAIAKGVQPDEFFPNYMIAKAMLKRRPK